MFCLSCSVSVNSRKGKVKEREGKATGFVTPMKQIEVPLWEIKKEVIHA